VPHLIHSLLQLELVVGPVLLVEVRIDLLREVVGFLFEDFDELAENVQAWDLEFTRLDQGPFFCGLL